MTNDEPSHANSSDKAFQDSTRDLAKLVISLASAVVVLSATFTEKLAQGVGVVIIVLFLSWVLLALSVISGVTACRTLLKLNELSIGSGLMLLSRLCESRGAYFAQGWCRCSCMLGSPRGAKLGRQRARSRRAAYVLASQVLPAPQGQPVRRAHVGQLGPKALPVQHLRLGALIAKYPTVRVALVTPEWY
jgi:hypothetical protein